MINIRERIHIIIKRREIYIVSAVLLGFAIICFIVPGFLDDTKSQSFLVNFNRQLMHFLIQYPLILLFSIPVFAILQNDMVFVRHGAYDKIFQTEVLVALVLALLYAAIKTMIECIFLFLSGGLMYIMATLVGFILLFLTAFMIMLLYLGLQSFLRKSIFSIMILTILLGLDTMSAVVYFPLLPDTLYLMALPLSTAAAYAMGGQVNLLLLFSISLLKIVLALVFFRFAIRRGKYA